MTPCLTDEALESHLAGRGPGPSVEAHLEGCAACRERLAAARADQELAGRLRAAVTPVSGSAAGAVPVASPEGLEDPLEQAPDLARYRILRRIGAGGMGIVFEAEQKSPRRSVALKVIRPGIVSGTLLQRFEHEAEVLGRLHHDGIAQIFEAGTFGRGHERRPFFAMELVRGRSLLAYVEAKRPRIRDRLLLFVEICKAVHHAHQKGVIHRDLKPANILVTAAGQPKILDFGVARAVDRDGHRTMHTFAGQILGTLSYMSPEQVGGHHDVADVRSDVYSLGVLLFELLTGKRPLPVEDLPLPEAARCIQESAPPPLRSLDAALRGDLETITAKALEKDPEHRYASALALATDVSRYLEDEPILARPPGTLYQLRKFARRNRVLVGSSFGILLALILGMVSTTRQWLRASDAELAARNAELAATAAAREAQAEARKARAITDFLMKTLVQASPRQRRQEEPTIREVLEFAAGRVVHDFREEPLVQAELHHTIGWTYLQMKDLTAARPHLQRALDLRREHLGDEHLDTAAAVSTLGDLLLQQGVLGEAEALLRQALATRRRSNETSPVLLSANLGNLALCLFAQGRREEAEVFSREAVEAARGLEDALDLPQHLVNLGTYLVEMQQDPEARKYLEEALVLLRRHEVRDATPYHSILASCLAQLGALQTRQGELREACRSLCEAAELRRGFQEELGASLAAALHELDRILLEMDAPSPLEVLVLRASVQIALDRVAAAAALAAPAAELWEEPASMAPEGLSAIRELAALLRRAGEPEAAEGLLSEVLSRARDQGDTGTVCAGLKLDLGRCLLEQGLYEDAELRLLEGWELLGSRLADGDADARAAARSLAELYEALGDPAEAEHFRRLLPDS